MTTAEVVLRQHRDGLNRLPEPVRPGAWRMLAGQLTHLLAVLLWVASGLALLAGMPELAAAIVVIVLLNAGFAFWQEYRADQSTERLRALLPALTRVLRNGASASVGADQLVVDDVVLLSAGDRVGADVVVLAANGLSVDESLVTGESGAVPHGPGDRLLAGTFVMDGEGRAIVNATGQDTTLARISSLTGQADRPPSPLTQQLDRVVRIVAVLAAVTGVSLAVASMVLGLGTTEAFLFGVGVSVALVPEGLLPTVTLSLARGAREMARDNALVRRLDAVETLGATTFICTDKTGTITQNRMSVVEVVTRWGPVTLHGCGYDPVATISGSENARVLAVGAARSALACVTGRTVQRHDSWVSDGDPMDAAVHCLTLRLGVPQAPDHGTRRAYTADRMLSSHLSDGVVSVLGAPEAVLGRCRDVPVDSAERLEALTGAGRRVLAVATGTWSGEVCDDMEHDLHFLALLALQDPPRPDVAEALARCRAAGIRVAMVTGDHPRTARTIAEEVGLLAPGGVVLDGRALPHDDARLAEILDTPHGAVVARVVPQGKLRIARCLRMRGHVVAMTGDGVNDAPALREADVGVAMGASGSDVARESADLVLLDDHFATIVRAIEQGRATFQNVRRFLTYHLTDNVAELAPFAVWALSGGSYPLALAVLQVLALDIGTDMLPALALGAEPPREGIMRGLPPRVLLDRALMRRSLLVLGVTEATLSMATFTAVLVHGGWRWGEQPSAHLLAVASGSAFAAIAIGQMANAFACRSTTRPVWRLRPADNPLVVAAVVAEIVLLVAFVGVPWLADLLGGSWPSGLGWAGALATGAGVVLVDGLVKTRRNATAARDQRRAGPGPSPLTPGAGCAHDSGKYAEN
ncbi:cation-translocating P-type ATPase [Nocardioides astragali]|uniref:Cation-translocating P-type ATPase n=1 Tax=Nocardioides astragali TaxID=1776736 RepID=A0ABW2NA86_9ACTN